MDFLFNLFNTENTNEIKKVNFEDIQMIISDKSSNTLLINTMDANQQKCLIKNTIDIHEEVNIINKLMNEQNFDVKIIIYDKNSNSKTIYKTYQQLEKLGFFRIYLYIGGLFEWLCLQDIYGNTEFPTTTQELDILKYKSKSIFRTLLLKDRH